MLTIVLMIIGAAALFAAAAAVRAIRHGTAAEPFRQADDGGGLLRGEFDEIADALDRGDWDRARLLLRKTAYRIHDASQEDQERFRQFMTEFAAADPLYAAGEAVLMQLVRAEPGVLQSAIYSDFSELTAEEVRYVCYFAAELGRVRRVKKGRSYALFPAKEQE